MASALSELRAASSLGTSQVGSTAQNVSNFFNNGGLLGHVGRHFNSPSLDAVSGASNGIPGQDSSVPDDNGLDPNGVDWIGYYENGINPFAMSASGEIPETPQPYSFMDTSLASIFGMDSATHYQEALSNTAYQRAVRDLKAAGLNPVLGISGNGAAVFSGTEGPANHLASALSVGSGSGSGSGASYGSVGSGKSTIDWSGVGKTLSYSAPYLVGGVVGLVTKNPYAASLAQSATSSLLNIGRYNIK